MSELSVSSVLTPNGTTDLPVATGNSTAIDILFSSAGPLGAANSTANVLFLATNGNIGIANNAPAQQLVVSSLNVSSNTFIGLSSLGPNGYAYLINGLLVQWGSCRANQAATDVTFSVPYTTAFQGLAFSNSGISNNCGSVISMNTTVIRVRSLQNGTDNPGPNIFWIAIGT